MKLMQILHQKYIHNDICDYLADDRSVCIKILPTSAEVGVGERAYC